MTRSKGLRIQLPLLVGALALAAGCTFEPPGSVLDNQAGPRPDAGGGGVDAGGGEAGETLTFTFTSEPTGAADDYPPFNVVATWIETAAGAYVATINRQAGVRAEHLVSWTAMAGAGNADAVTGATRDNHATPVVVTWAIPAELANGTYTIRVETADANTNDGGAPADNNQGTFTFEKNGVSSTQTALVGGGYTGVSIDYAVVAP